MLPLLYTLDFILSVGPYGGRVRPATSRRFFMNISGKMEGYSWDFHEQIMEKHPLICVGKIMKHLLQSQAYAAYAYYELRTTPLGKYC